MKGFTDMMMAILIGVLLVFGALAFFATEINNMERSMNMVLREYEIEIAKNEYLATKRSLRTSTMLSGANAVFDLGLIGIGDVNELSEVTTSLKPTLWYLNHTPPVVYLFEGIDKTIIPPTIPFQGFEKEYRYTPTKKDIEDKAGLLLQLYMDETNSVLNKKNNHRIKLPGLNVIDLRLRNLGSSGAKISQEAKYGVIHFEKINPVTIPGAMTSVPEKKGNYVYIPGEDTVYKSGVYIPKCYLFGGTCTDISGVPGGNIKNEIGCNDYTCGCPDNKACMNIQNCEFSCPLNESKKIDMTSGFGCRNLNGIEFHPGVDLIYGSDGNIIYAPSDGILYAFYTDEESGGYGNMFVIAHGCYDGSPRIYFTIYGHLESLYDNINWEINKGDEIAYMGSSGHSTGKHLHYEIRKNEDKEYNGVLEVKKPAAHTNLVNPCDLSNGKICGNCDCESECEHEGYSCENGYSCEDNCNCQPLSGVEEECN